MKLANIDREILHLLNDLRNLNEILRKDVTYDNIKSYKNPGIHPLFRRYSFGKPQGGGVKLTPAVLGLAKSKLTAIKIRALLFQA